MFTGIIQALGEVARLDRRGADGRLRVRCVSFDWSDTELGDSIAVNGVCLTAVEIDGDGFGADVSAETLARTTLGGLAAGDAVNLEPALRLDSRLGGHLVSGHVDGLGEVLERSDEGRSVVLTLRSPQELSRYIAPKGSICVDGVSLTVNRVQGAEFWLNIVPHTLGHTTLGEYRAGRHVNLEVDLIARYLERLLSAEHDWTDSGLSREFLARHGFGGTGRAES